jgi:hypothetical protein
MNQFLNTNEPSNENTGGTIDTNSYGSYYKPEKRKSHIGRVLLFIILIGIVLAVLWYMGYLTPKDKNAEYTSLNDRICNAATKYANNSKYNSKIKGISTPGKVFYLKISNLVSANLLASNLVDPLTNEEIDTDTDIRMTVISAGNISCNGIALPADDKVVPVVTLNGDATVELTAGSTYTDPGATATDNKDGDISDRVERSGNVDLSKAGTYYIYYFVIDRAGNISNKVVRTLVVK